LQVLPGLLKASNSPTNSQLLYELSLCSWQMTYVKQAAEAMGAPMVKALVEVCRTAQKEKVFRMALCALRNLLNYEDLHLASDMVEAGLTKVVATRQMQAWGDEDIGDILTFMDEKLKEGVQVSSNFERYTRI
jgi:V-type H+-transporting ATPase subunit H